MLIAAQPFSILNLDIVEQGVIKWGDSVEIRKNPRDGEKTPYYLSRGPPL